MAPVGIVCRGFNEETVNEIKRSRAVQTVVNHVSRFEFDLKLKGISTENEK